MLSRWGWRCQDRARTEWEARTVQSRCQESCHRLSELHGAPGALGRPLATGMRRFRSYQMQIQKAWWINWWAHLVVLQVTVAFMVIFSQLIFWAFSLELGKTSTFKRVREAEDHTVDLFSEAVDCDCNCRFTAARRFQVKDVWPSV